MPETGNNLPKYVKVLLPLKLDHCYTYALPEALAAGVQNFVRVSVPLGTKKVYSGIVTEILHTVPPEDAAYTLKPILSVLDDFPVITSLQYQLWQWIAGYYLCTPGEVMAAAMPSALRLSGETTLALADDDGTNPGDDHKNLIVQLLRSRKQVSFSEIATSLPNIQIHRCIKELIAEGVVTTGESLHHKVRLSPRQFLCVSPDFQQPEQLNLALDRLKRSPKQLEFLTAFLNTGGYSEKGEFRAMARGELTKQFPGCGGVIKALIEKGILNTSHPQQPSAGESSEQSLPKTLTTHQQQAITEIRQQFKQKDIVLLQGVTASGKTEVYIHLINEALQQQQQVLYLLPEIALTTQIIQRLHNVFGDRVAVYHSKFSDRERFRLWDALVADGQINRSGPSIVLGVRAAVFLPFTRLGLVIVDEEHETTFKQFDPAPRYHARDTAIVLAMQFGAKVLLGTATPSVETFFNIQSGKYGHVQLTQRYNDTPLPQITTVDKRIAWKRRQMHGMFSDTLLGEISQALEAGKQVILFQNRRGFAPYVECEECGHIPVCRHCDVSLTYHKTGNKLVCHYCGYTEPLQPVCHTCKGPKVFTRGFGTEKIDEEIRHFFPQAGVARLDMDTTGSLKSYERIIERFEQGETNILVGTQMLTKGLDFRNVALVGIINADAMLSFPDFRAHERSFQLMTQVAGRAGRSAVQGRVVIQTSDPDNPVIEKVRQNDINGFLHQQMAERQQFMYPPFVRLVKVKARHIDATILNQAAKHLAQRLHSHFGRQVLGPHEPLIGRIQRYYIREIWIKIPRDANFYISLGQIRKCLGDFRLHESFRRVDVYADVDPY